MSEELRKRFEKETGKEAIEVVYGHGERGFASWDYQIWLETKISALESRLSAVEKERDEAKRVAQLLVVADKKKEEVRECFEKWWRLTLLVRRGKTTRTERPPRLSHTGGTEANRRSAMTSNEKEVKDGGAKKLFEHIFDPRHKLRKRKFKELVDALGDLHGCIAFPNARKGITHCGIRYEKSETVVRIFKELGL